MFTCSCLEHNEHREHFVHLVHAVQGLDVWTPWTKTTNQNMLLFLNVSRLHKYGESHYAFLLTPNR